MDPLWARLRSGSRFGDLQVLKQIEGVIEVILQVVSESREANPPLPPFLTKGGTDRRAADD